MPIRRYAVQKRCIDANSATVRFALAMGHK
jgi:hypothetical protein